MTLEISALEYHLLINLLDQEVGRIGLDQSAGRTAAHLKKVLESQYTQQHRPVNREALQRLLTRTKLLLEVIERTIGQGSRWPVVKYDPDFAEWQREHDPLTATLRRLQARYGPPQ